MKKKMTKEDKEDIKVLKKEFPDKSTEQIKGYLEETDVLKAKLKRLCDKDEEFFRFVASMAKALDDTFVMMEKEGQKPHPEFIFTSIGMALVEAHELGVMSIPTLDFVNQK